VRALGLGVRLDHAWFCSNRCVTAEAADRLRQIAASEPLATPAPTPLGTVLLQQKGITQAQLKSALLEQRKSGLRLGDQLLQMAYTSPDAVLKALAAQGGVPYLATIDQSAVRTAPGGLSGDEVRALGLVPFRAADQVLMVACRAPLPQAALAALHALTGRIVEPYLVSDAAFERLLRQYGAGVPASVPTTTVRDISEGASRIAAVAAEAGDVTLREARVDPFTWVRIAADGQISTLLVPPFPQEIEDHQSWLAATTPH
ncbi:MAG: hypothetical protein ABL961_17195, partial [Vicinamibacterales bacterium]